MAAVKSWGKWGFINDNYNLVIPCEYLKADDFRDGRSEVIVNETTKTQHSRGSAQTQNYDSSGRITSSTSSSNVALSMEIIYTTYYSIDKTGKVIAEHVTERFGRMNVVD